MRPHSLLLSPHTPACCPGLDPASPPCPDLVPDPRSGLDLPRLVRRNPGLGLLPMPLAWLSSSTLGHTVPPGPWGPCLWERVTSSSVCMFADCLNPQETLHVPLGLRVTIHTRIIITETASHTP